MKWLRFAWFGALIALGCGADSATATSDDADSASDAGPKLDVSSKVDGSSKHDASVEASDGPFDIFDALPLPDGPCGNCIRDACGAEINDCASNGSCRAGLLCTLESCLPAGAADAGLDLACVLTCFGGDITTALNAYGAFTCVTTNCETSCIAPEGGTLDDGAIDASTNGDVESTPPDSGREADPPVLPDSSTDGGPSD